MNLSESVRVGVTLFLQTTASANAAAARHLVVLDRDPKIVMFSDSVSKKSERTNASAVVKLRNGVTAKHIG